MERRHAEVASIVWCAVHRPLVVALLLGLWQATSPAPARATLYGFTEVANAQILGAQTVTGASINDSGRVAFSAQFATMERGYYTTQDGTTDMLFLTPPTNAAFGATSINNPGDVAFASGFSSVIKHDAALNALVTIADDSGPFNIFLSNPSINDAGAVAFLGLPDGGGRTIAAGTGGALSFVATSPGPVYDDLSSRVVINPGGPTFQVAFQADTSVDRAVFRGGSLAPATRIASDSGLFSLLQSGVSINDAGQVLFGGILNNGVGGVFLGDGVSTTPVADSSGPMNSFDTFSGLAVSNTGAAFVASLDVTNEFAVFTGPHIQNDRVLTIGQGIPGFPSTITSVTFGPDALNDTGQLVMNVAFADGRRSVIVASPLGSIQQFAAAGDVAAALKSVGTAQLGQLVDTPSDQVDLVFEYLFTTPFGELTVMLGDQTLTSITARSDLSDALTEVTVPLDFTRTTLPPVAELTFVLQGTEALPSGLVLDNIRFPGILNGGFVSGDLSDWTVLTSQGSAVGVTPFPGTLVAIPEPATAVLLPLVVAAVLKRRTARAP